MVQTRVRLIYQGFALLAPPILFVIWVVSGAGVRWFASRGSGFRDSLFSANTMVMALIWLGYVMTLINLCFYAMHVYREAFKGGANSSDRRNLIIVWWVSLAIAFVISAFLIMTAFAFLGIQIPYITCDRVIVINHYLLLVIFCVFLIMDWRAMQSAKRQSPCSTIDIVAAKFSIWLVSMPSIFVTVLALLLHYRLLNNPDWLLLFDKPEILSGDKYGYLHVPLVAPSAQERPLFGLFVSGLNIGLTMASIMVSQMAFFFIEVFRDTDKKME